MSLRNPVRWTLGLWALMMLAATPASAGLFEYVKSPDASFAWKLESNHDTPAGKILSLSFTSQKWHDITWKHNLTVYVPKDVKYPDAALLFVTGGSTDSKVKESDHILGFTLAKNCGCAVALLPQVPNQPLFGDHKEDDLITETFLKYLDTEDDTWPLLFPMVKSAVKAMDAVQELGKEHGQTIKRFVVTGASKRGWTTWLTGAVDDRVVAIAPMVIPTLNFKAQNAHQLETWGKYSEQIDDYVRKGLMEQLSTGRGQKLWKMVDPYTYLDRLASKPILQINGTNDRYWTLDSLNVYWDDIKTPYKYVVYLPNAGHNLSENRNYALDGVGALCRHVLSGTPGPQITWKHVDTADGKLELRIESSPPAKAAKLQVARSDTKDFREAKWKPEGEASGGQITFTVDRPRSGSIALFGDLTYEVDGLEYHLSTQIRQVNPPAAAAAKAAE